jgi:hypothetical protein
MSVAANVTEHDRVLSPPPWKSNDGYEEGAFDAKKDDPWQGWWCPLRVWI